MTTTPEHTAPAADADHNPDDDWWNEPPKDPVGPAGCRAACPIATSCPRTADDGGTHPTCAATDTTPAAPADGDPLTEAREDRRGTDMTEVVSRSVEAAASAAFGFGWLDLVIGAVQRGNASDADGNPVDWGRLQLKRNGLAVLVVTLVPLGDHTAARWVAQALNEYHFGAVFYPLGTALGFGLPVVLGQYVPGLTGTVCSGTVRAAAFTARALGRFAASRLGWILTRPLIWAAVCGLLIVTWRFLVHILTGA
ncbi:hypothetical protein ABZ714_26545 [Streptomyces sp. NPDC006798]|uniref:hypothetical protein n=1 Tax=Streptomyces sp. NPDC006798 TaxID=3155462 RepID=UPI00340DA3B0